MLKDKKYKKLVIYLENLGKVAVAFSGGVDSTFLLHTAREVLKDKLIALTAVSPYIPKWEVEEAKVFTKRFRIKHHFVKLPIPEVIRNNPADRCYLCKGIIFQKLKLEAANFGFEHLLDGTNFDDLNDYRPGLKALEELDIKSPLRESELNKQDIRSLSKEIGLDTWDKPAYSCLLTRIPCGQEVKVEDLEMIEKSEKYLINMGYRNVRVRSHGEIARIEIENNRLEEFIAGKNLIQIVNKLKQIGFKYITLDVEGYKMGSMNKVK